MKFAVKFQHTVSSKIAKRFPLSNFVRVGATGAFCLLLVGVSACSQREEIALPVTAAADTSEVLVAPTTPPETSAPTSQSSALQGVELSKAVKDYSVDELRNELDVEGKAWAKMIEQMPSVVEAGDKAKQMGLEEQMKRSEARTEILLQELSAR